MILQSLNRYYERLSSKNQAPPYGYSSEKISYAVVLSAKGQAVDVMPLLEMLNNRPHPTLRQVPRPPSDRRGGKIVPNFLWDNTKYALGSTYDRQSTGPVRTSRHYEAFKTFHQNMLEGVEDEGIQAFLAFLTQWDPDAYSKLTSAAEMLDKNIVFRLDGEQGFLHERFAAKHAWLQRLSKSAGNTRGMCLVTGAHAPIARLHPAIKGVRDAQPSGANIVSFNQDAFASLGKSQGENAPISEAAAFAYTTALNTLLARGSRQKVQIGDTATVFWAEAAENPMEAQESESLIASLLNPQLAPSDEEETARLADSLQQITEGRPLADVAPQIKADTRFYILGLAPNAARLSVRFWQETSVGGIFEQIANHWRDMRLKPAAWRVPPSAGYLLRQTTIRRNRKNPQYEEDKKVSPVLIGTLMRSILTGAQYPRIFLAAVITRFRVGGDVSALRVAVVKACVRRAERLENPDKEDTLMSLDPSSLHVAYNLGRLFAAYAYAEKSHSNPNATIRDKYMGTASANPRRVFPTLMRGYEHNRAALLKKGGTKASSGVRADKAVGEILGNLPGSGKLPATLSLEDQGRFFIGYYHQEQAFYSKAVPESTLQQSDLEE